ncbi:MAG: hypothetical protein R3B06_05115 [Kofleriaceae bacterium]
MSPHRAPLAVLALLVATAGLAARPAHAEDDGVVVVNGGASASDLDKLRRRLEDLGFLQPTPTAITAALDDLPPYDLDQIKAAYGNFEYDHADELISTALGDLFAHGDADQFARGTAELLYWRGLTAFANENPTDAAGWFAAAFRIDPDLPVDNAVASPEVRKLIARSSKAKPAKRPLYLQGDVLDGSSLAIDGGPPRPITDEVDVALGFHLVVVTSAKHKPFAALVEVRTNRNNGVNVTLDPEDEVSRARRLRVSTLDADTTTDRLRQARRLIKLTQTGEPGRATKVLVIDANQRVRVYDVERERESPELSLREATMPNRLASLLGVDMGQLGTAPPVWYKRWYVWAAVGAVVTGSAIGAYAYSQREPTRITGF